LFERVGAFYKVVILGDSGVGKTSLLNRCVHNTFYNGEYKATIGADFLTKIVHLPQLEKDITLQIWDTAGQERFVSICLAFYRGSDCCVLVYDINDPISVENLEKWINFFDQECNINDISFPVVVIGNKTDQKTEESIENIEKAKLWCQERNYPHFETSAKEDNNSNVDAIFQHVSELLYQSKPSIMDIYDDDELTSSLTNNHTSPTRRSSLGKIPREQKGGCCS